MALNGKWRHEDTIAEFQIAEIYWIVKARHAMAPAIGRNCVQLRATWKVNSRLRFERSMKLHRGEVVVVVANSLEGDHDEHFANLIATIRHSGTTGWSLWQHDLGPARVPA